MRLKLLLLAEALCILSSVSLATLVDSKTYQEDVESLVQVAKRLQTGRSVNLPVMAIPVCSKKDIEDYSALFASTLKREGERWLNVTADTKAVVYPHISPLLNATKLASAIIMERALKPTFVEVAKQLLRMVGEAKVQRNGAVDLARTSMEFQQHYALASIQASHVMLKGLAALDGSLNAQARRSLGSIASVLPGISARLPRRDQELLPYLVGKVIPIVGMEFFPEVPQLLTLLTHVPKNPRDMPKYLATVIAPFFAKALPRLMQYRPIEMPKRKCVTCRERYAAALSEGEDGKPSCSQLCLQVLGSCNRVDGACMRQLSPCLHCHSQQLGYLSVCEGKQADGAAYKKLAALADTIDGTDFASPVSTDRFADVVAHTLFR